MYSYVFGDYWEDIGTIKAFYEANLDLTSPMPRYNFFDHEQPIYTRARALPSSKINKSVINEALVSDGCIIYDATIRRSLIGLRSVIEENCTITESIIMGADFYEKAPLDGNAETKGKPIRIGAGSRIHKAIIDKNAIIGRNVVIDPGDHENADFEYGYVRDGIAVITKSMEIPDGTVVCENPQ
jgi:glucose-1-phosphate adenylyltransferase